MAFLAIRSHFNGLWSPDGDSWPMQRFQCTTPDMPWLVLPLFHTLPPVWGHQTRLWPRLAVFALLDPFGPYNGPKWLEQYWGTLEQVDSYQKEAKKNLGCHEKPTSKIPPISTLCPIYPRPPFTHQAEEQIGEPDYDGGGRPAVCWGRFGVSGGLKEGMMVDYGDCRLACWTQEVRGSAERKCARNHQDTLHPKVSWKGIG